MSGSSNPSGLIGKTIGQYQIIEQIGQGGMATVYKAYQFSIDRYVAVKILPDQFAQDPNFVKRFEHEAKAIAALEHPHILPVHDFGVEQDIYYMVMRYVDGGTLSNVMAQELPYEQITKYVSDIARALDYAHRQGVVHRDIKPSNVLIDQHQEVLLTDFGISKIVAGSKATQVTATGHILGTPAYMAPEQAQSGEVDGRSDIYALGVILYELLTGRPPYSAETPFAVALKHISEPLPLPRKIKPDIPEAFERVVLKAMAKEPEQRFETAGDMAEALRQALKESEHPPAVSPKSATLSPESDVSSLTPAEPPTTAHVPHETGSIASEKSGTKNLFLVGSVVATVLICVVGGGLLAALFLFSDADLAESDIDDDDDDQIAEVVASPEIEAQSSLDDPPETILLDEASSLDQEIPLAEEKPDQVETSQALTPHVIFEDDFSANENQWPQEEYSDEFGTFMAFIEEEIYVIGVESSSEDGNTDGVTFPIEPVGDFILSVDAFAEDSDSQSGYGIFFRSSPKGEYVFELEQDTFALFLSTEEEYFPLVDYTYSEAIIPDEPNRLMIEAVGSQLSFFINGQEVAVVEDDTLQTGTTGFYISIYEEGEAFVAFDNLVISAP